ncbi:MAG TPA: FAD-binding oxidoreductase [Acidimicrobiales bacterium]|nr:FAD-binding oxidoreductase [Acidimicrobiales bacterium]
MAPVDDALLRSLREVVGARHVLTDADVVAGYVTDFTGRFAGSTPAVVRPGTTAEVAGVMACCRARGVALCVQGGNTGLVGGGVPLGGEVVLSLRRLDALDAVDPVAGQLTAGAGVTIGAVQQAASAAGWSYGVDLSSRGSATVGGTVATNAGGLRMLRYGDTRAQLLGVEAVLGTGAVVSHLGGLVKDNTGYDLAGLLCGSEGTLGVVTAARLRLVPPAHHTAVALLAFDAVEPAVAAAQELRRTLPALSAAELFFAAGLDLVCRSTGRRAPFERLHEAYLLVEAAAAEDPVPALGASIDSLDAVAAVAVAVDEARAAQLWHYREAHAEAVNRLGAPHKLDVTLPAAHLASFVREVPAVVAAVAPCAQVWVFGHAADGNVHVNVTGVDPGDDTVDDAVLRRVAAAGGSISAEHGIGTAKRRWLSLNRTDEEIGAFRALKAALDPDGLLNPRVLLPD